MKLLILLLPNLLWANPLERANTTQRLSQAVTFKTVSESVEAAPAVAEFKKYHSFLRKNYPLTFSKLEVIPIELSLLMIWKGESPESPSALFNAHADVVPVNIKDLPQWEHPPFAGATDKDFVWGRGTMDNKIAVQALFESLEKLLKQEFEPQGNLYFAITHDEEIGGWNGAYKITQYLKAKSHRVDFVYDEGMVIIKDVMKDFPKPVAMIGVGEKGYATFKLTVLKPGGHSSMPAKETSITILNRALARLSNPLFKRRLIAPLVHFFEVLGSETKGLSGFILRNPAFFSSLLMSDLENSPASDALIKTTHAITMVNAGVKENIIPNTAEATINFRILQGNTVENIQKLIVKKIKDPRVVVSLPDPKNAVNPSPLASTKTKGYQFLSEAIKEIHPKTLVAPSLMLARTDSYHYQALTKNIYRFLPLEMTKSEVSRIHGINEKVSIDNYQRIIQFYKKLIQKY